MVTTSAANDAAQPMTSWTSVEQGLMPILVALMTRMLPEVIVAAGCPNARDSRAVRRLVDRADALLISQTPELGHVALVRRRRYWRTLLHAMLEDKVIIPPKGKKTTHKHSP